MWSLQPKITSAKVLALSEMLVLKSQHVAATVTTTLASNILTGERDRRKSQGSYGYSGGNDETIN